MLSFDMISRSIPERRNPLTVKSEGFEGMGNRGRSSEAGSYCSTDVIQIKTPFKPLSSACFPVMEKLACRAVAIPAVTYQGAYIGSTLRGYW